MIAAILSRMVEPHRVHLIRPEACLDRDLKLDAFQRHYCIPEAIREAIGREVPDREIDKWQTVACVMRTLAGLVEGESA